MTPNRPENPIPDGSTIALMRSFVVDFFDRHDAAACRRIMRPDYTLRIGDLVIAGRDEQYLPAVQRQFDQFPGLVMTVHTVMVSGEMAALHFSEHGASGGAGGRLACWTGVALYRASGGQLAECVTVEDYDGRRRQLTSGVVDDVGSPMAAPWDVPSRPPDAEAERAVRRWLEAGGHLDGAPRLHFEIDGTDVTDIFSAASDDGSSVAFHARQTGRYIGGLASHAASDRSLVLFSAGIVDVADATVHNARVVLDRAALDRLLRAG